MSGAASSAAASSDSPVAADVVVRRGGEATPEEVAAIVAAVEVTWPRPSGPASPTGAPRWRFSGRWWTKPVPLRRSRPW